MKFFAVFAAIVAVAFGSHTSWTLQQLSEALQNPATDPAAIPYLEDALNQMMDALVSGHQVEAVTIAAASIDVSHWTLQELNAALDNPATNVALVPYLEHALNEMMDALFAGQQPEVVAIVTPAGLLEAPTPVPVVPSPVETPAPAPVESPVPSPSPAAGSPLVQIIVNINQQEQSAPAPAPVTPGAAAEIAPEPVIVVEQPLEIKPEPVAVVDAAPVPVDPVVVAPTPEFNPIDAAPIPGIILPSPVVVAPLPAVVGPMI